jgi:hypothetical protein
MLLLFQDDTENQTTSEKKEGTKKKKNRVKTVELPIEAHTHGYSQTELNNYMELEVSKPISLWHVSTMAKCLSLMKGIIRAFT